MNRPIVIAPKMSRSKAINEKCKDCIYDHASPGSWRSQVEACTSQSCALWQHRPLTVETINANRKGVPVTADGESEED